MRGATIPLAITVILMAILIGLIRDNSPTTASLHVYCAASVKTPVAKVAKAYEDEYGVTIQLQYGGSGSLLSNLELSPQGDIYIAADASYTDIAREKGLVQETLPVCPLLPVIAVPKGNPKNIRTIDDLLSSTIRLSLANPDAASIGKTTKNLLTLLGRWNEVEAVVQIRGVFKPTVPEVANDVKLGIADAGIIWDVTANQYPELEIIPLESAIKFQKHVTIGVLTSSKQPSEALRFAHYLTTSKIGGDIFEANGFL